MSGAQRSLALISLSCALGVLAFSANSEAIEQITFTYSLDDKDTGPVLQITNNSKCSVNYYSVRYEWYYVDYPEKPGFSASGSLLGEAIRPGEALDVHLRRDSATESEIDSEAKLSHAVFTKVSVKDLSKVSRRISGEWEFAENTATLNVEKCWS